MRTKEHFLAIYQRVQTELNKPDYYLSAFYEAFALKEHKTIDDYFEVIIRDLFVLYGNNLENGQNLENCHHKKYFAKMWAVGGLDPAKAFKEFLNAIDALIDIVKPINSRFEELILNSARLVDAYSNAKLFNIDVTELSTRFSVTRVSFVIQYND